MSEKLEPKRHIQIKGVYPKDIFVELEISLKGINCILDYMGPIDRRLETPLSVLQ